MSKKLTFFQVFNAMRIYMTDYFEEHNAEDIGLMLSGLKLDSSYPNWKKDLPTWDAAALEDWMDGVSKTLSDLNIQQNPKETIYDEWMAFLCMKNYLQLFYQEVPFDDVKNILKIINKVQPKQEDSEWSYWINCTQSAIDQEPHIKG